MLVVVGVVLVVVVVAVVVVVVAAAAAAAAPAAVVIVIVYFVVVVVVAAAAAVAFHFDEKQRVFNVLFVLAQHFPVVTAARFMANMAGKKMSSVYTYADQNLWFKAVASVEEILMYGHLSIKRIIGNYNQCNSCYATNLISCRYRGINQFHRLLSSYFSFFHLQFRNKLIFFLKILIILCKAK